MSSSLPSSISQGLRAASLREKESQAVEASVPSHLLFLIVESIAAKKEYEFREDTMLHLNRAAIVPLAKLDSFTIARVAKRTDETVRSLLSGLSVDRLEHALAGSCFFVLKLVDEGLLPQDNMAHIIAVGLIQDMRAEGSHWPKEEIVSVLMANKMLASARAIGLYKAHLSLPVMAAE